MYWAVLYFPAYFLSFLWMDAVLPGKRRFLCLGKEGCLIPSGAGSGGGGRGRSVRKPKQQRSGRIISSENRSRKGNVPVLFDLPGEVWDFSLIWSVAGFLSFSSILFFLVFFYLIRRDRLYQRAFRTLEQFRGGDFAKRLPRGEPGSLYQLLI